MYKEQAGKSQSTTQDDLVWLKHLSDWQAETQDPGEFLDALRFEIGAKEV
jgi:GTP pyrophosphokinase